MEIEKAIKVLETYNEWRTGADTKLEKPEIITEAINVVVGYIKSYEILIKTPIVVKYKAYDFTKVFSMWLSANWITISNNTFKMNKTYAKKSYLSGNMATVTFNIDELFDIFKADVWDKKGGEANTM